jgi:hypothetical protein
MLGLLTGKEEKEWLSFKKELNGFKTTKCITSDRTREVIFLDLKISINSKGYIDTKTYQKAQNLHLYITCLSAHSDVCLKGAIFGNAICYW